MIYPICPHIESASPATRRSSGLAAYNDRAAGEAELRAALGALLALVEGPAIALRVVGLAGRPAIALRVVGLAGRPAQGRPVGVISVAGVRGTVHLAEQENR